MLLMINHTEWLAGSSLSSIKARTLVQTLEFIEPDFTLLMEKYY